MAVLWKKLSFTFRQRFLKNGKMSNEKGIYNIVDIAVNSKMKLVLSADYYHYDWLRYQVEAPTKNMDVSVKMEYRIRRNSFLAGQYSYKTTNKNEQATPYFKSLDFCKHHRFRLQFSYPLFGTSCMLKTELSGIANYSNNKTAWGWMLFQDIQFDIKKTGLNVKCRFAVFDTETYDERLYAYENDLTYTFTIGSYYYQGIKSYLVLKYKFSIGECQLKLSSVIFNNKNEIGSGLELINGNHRSEIKVQLFLNLH